ncbi:hypothetical protein RclHR1_10990008 [Rhizophagus clarus]|uniref:FAD-binding PCMH-type domain-containing protein n=1 Tax=Rhizophagus clarus TaxID=94130 RepID=A0A2Z6Q3E0_9GLOM|nr:hypothetical protein RclHR1_10990008 [Rhizophagus clarus]
MEEISDDDEFKNLYLNTLNKLASDTENATSDESKNGRIGQEPLVIIRKNDHLSCINVEKRTNCWVVHAEAGAQISKIDNYLKNYEPPLTIESMTVLDSVRIGGVVTTGFYDAKTYARTIVEQVVGLEIIDAKGNLCKFSDEICREDMSAARVNLGLLGIIYKVSLLVKPMYNLRMKNVYPKLVSFTEKDIHNYVEKMRTGNPTDSLEDVLWIKSWERTLSAVSLTPDKLSEYRKKQNAMTICANKQYKVLLKHPKRTPIVTHRAWNFKLKFDDDTNFLHFTSDVKFCA